jgi:hypothetical protein
MPCAAHNASANRPAHPSVTLESTCFWANESTLAHATCHLWLLESYMTGIPGYRQAMTILGWLQYFFMKAELRLQKWRLGRQRATFKAACFK